MFYKWAFMSALQKNKTLTQDNSVHGKAYKHTKVFHTLYSQILRLAGKACKFEVSNEILRVYYKWSRQTKSLGETVNLLYFM